MSTDGRFVAFFSLASNLVAGDTNGTWDVFVHDRQTGVTERVSVDSAGNQANGVSVNPTISADGRFVAFTSGAGNLVPGDTNATEDIFVHDRMTGATERVSVDSDGNQANNGSIQNSISADGRFVAFLTLATNLVPGDTNGFFDIVVHDRQTGVTELVSVDSDGNQGDGQSQSPGISGDGRFVAFLSFATNLVTGDTNNVRDIFVHDRQTGVTERVNVDSTGNQANGSYSFGSAISADGRFVAFESDATNLVTEYVNFRAHIYVHDRQTGATERVSVDSDGNQADRSSFSAALSADGRFVVFLTHATNLVTGDTGFIVDVFVHDRQTGVTERVSVDSVGNQADSGSFRPAVISDDGRFVAFDTPASNLVAGDTNNVRDIFVRDRLVTNQPPIADAGPDQNVTAPGATGAMVTLDGSGSSDPDPDDSLNYSWVGPFEIVTSINPTVSVPPGTHHISLTVTDDIGATDSDVVQIDVAFDFLGFQQPVEGYPVINTAKAGRSIPIKWQVSDGAGGYISDLGIVASLQFAPADCEAVDGTYENPVDADDSGDSGLRYDTLDEQYVYSWKTAKSMSDTCSVFVLSLTDGTTHLALFKLK